MSCLRANPTLAASALLAFLDKDADPDLRFDGATLIAAAIDDLFLLRSVLIKREGE